MKKYKHIQPKYKTAKRLPNLSKYRRHKKIRESIFNSRKKLVSLRASYNRIKHKYFLKKEKLGFFDVAGYSAKTPRDQASSGNYLSRTIGTSQEKGGYQRDQIRLAKKKYKIHSYLFNATCKSPRKYVYHFFGKDILRKYYTMPFRLNISRFTSNKVSRSYYRTLSHKALLNLCQKASRGRGVNIGLDIRGSSISGARASRRSDIVERAERAKNFTLCLEERLDSTLLRLLHFKPLTSLSSVKRSLSIAVRKQKSEVSAMKQVKLTKYPKYQIKSPWTMFGAERIRQLISHGHIPINGKKVQSPGAQVRPGDQIQIKGSNEVIVSFADTQGRGDTPNIAESLSTNKSTKTSRTQPVGVEESLKRNHKSTLLLRRFRDQNHSNRLDNLNESGGANSDSTEDIASQEMSHNYIKGSKIKRFTEAFHMTYRNLHSIERTSSSPVSLSYTNHEVESNQSDRFHGAPEIQGVHAVNDNGQSGTMDVEKHIQPVSETIGYNQSIYLSWPVISLLRSYSWGPGIKRAVIQSSTRAIGGVAFRGSRNNSVANAMNEQTRQGQEVLAQQQKRKLQNLLKWKKLQASASEVNALNSQGPKRRESSIPHLIRSLLLRNPSWLHTQTRGVSNSYNKSQQGSSFTVQQSHGTQKSFRSYASIVYGTRKCKWIRLQQGSGGAKGSFYNRIPNHTQFSQLELEFFQSVYRGIQGQS